MIHVSKIINERKTESTCIIWNSDFKSKLNSFSLIVLYLYGSCLKNKTPIFMFKFRVYSQKLSVYLQKLAFYRDNFIKKILYNFDSRIQINKSTESGKNIHRILIIHVIRKISYRISKLNRILFHSLFFMMVLVWNNNIYIKFKFRVHSQNNAFICNNVKRLRKL